MQKIFPLVILFLVTCTINPPEPKNAQSLSEALQLAKELKRPVLIDFMTDW